MRQPHTITWPKHFQPRSGQEQPPTEAPLRIPATVLDMFYLRARPTSPSALVAIIGCLQADLDVVVGDAINALPEDIRGQIRGAEVSRRGLFRAITARELYVASLDALDQAEGGLNAALHLYGRMQARIICDATASRTAPLDNEGRLTVGRLNLFHAYLEGVTHAFQSPAEADVAAYQFMLPVAPAADIERGSGITIVYPVLDPLTFKSIDNSFIVMRIIYDLLVRLQQDMLKEQHRHPFATAMIPVPSRHRLEAELQADGYAIRGDVAEQRLTQPHDPQAHTWLQRLRTLAQQWSAPRIMLPPQATPHDYHRLIADILPAISTPEDSAMAQAMARLVEARVAPALPPILTPAPTQARPADRVEPNTARRPPPTVAPPAPLPKQDWSRDFAAHAAPQPPERRTTGGKAYTGATQKLTPDDLAWWQAAAAAAGTSKTQRLTTKAEWTQDFLVEKGMQITRVPTPTPESKPTTDDWSSDFAAPATPKPSDTLGKEWASDFEPQD